MCGALFRSADITSPRADRDLLLEKNTQAKSSMRQDNKRQAIAMRIHKKKKIANRWVASA
jgi:hypothetical protein